MIVDQSRTWLDTRWVHQGRTRFGVDCAGLLVMVLRELGQPVEDMEGYRRTPDGRVFREFIRNQTVMAPTIRPGTIALFRDLQFPTHCGFFAERDGKLTVIHAHVAHRKVIEEPFEHELPKLLIDYRDINGILD